ncbi:MAG: hypothetical protein NTU98_07965 [Bacteroidetes bacterium]|nr:hypothetical protein [Bacteroidota bacterium]
MKIIIENQVKEMVISHLDQYRVLEGVGYDANNCSNWADYLGIAPLGAYKGRFLPLSPLVSIFKDAVNLYRVEVELRSELLEFFYFKVVGKKLIFDFDRLLPDTVYHRKTFAGIFFNVDEKNEDTIRYWQEKLKGEPVPVPFVQFMIEEKEFRRFEKDRANNFRRPKMLKLKKQYKN